MTFYHGTDARISRMPEEERKTFRKEILAALDYMWDLMEPYFQKYDEVPDYKHNRIKRIEKINVFEEKMNEDSYDQFYSALSHDKARRDNLKTWQYQEGVLYLTTRLATAISYAYRSTVFGELGETAWNMYQGIRKLNLDTWNPSDEIQAILDKIERFATEEPYPIVYMIDKINRDYLFTDAGELVLDELLEVCSQLNGRFNGLFRYDEPHFSLDLNNKSHTIFLRPMNEILDFVYKKKC